MLAEKVKRFIVENSLISENDSLLVAFSGGADSMCLLHVLKSLSYNVSAAHLNHMIRGEEAYRDAEAAEAFCKDMLVPFYLYETDVPSISKEKGISEETAGRLERYNFFSKLAHEKGIDKIVTAHNKNDNAETVLMHIIRGCGTDGLSGIPKTRGNIVRPLLDCTRSEIEEYCRTHSLPYVIDSTNLECKYTRNSIRLELIPFLEKYNPSILSALSNLSSSASADKDFFKNKTDIICGEKTALSVDSIKDIEPALLYRVIARLADNADISYEAIHIKKIFDLIKTGVSGKRIDLPGGFFEISCGMISALSSVSNAFCFKISPNSTIELDNYILTASDKKTSDINFVLPTDGDICIRTRQPGDRIKVRGMTKKLSDLFIDNKIPANKRDKIPVLTLNDEIIYVFGLEKSDLINNSVKYEKSFVLNISNKEYTNE